jgi:hypothetical protein
MIRALINRAIKKMRRGDWYDQDGLQTLHNHDFMRDPRFERAYARGVRAAEVDYHFHWRVHVALWVASSAVNLPGEFVECGVNKGAISSAIMEYLDWNSTGKTFYLLDTFGGLDPRQIAEADVATMARNREWVASGYYESNVDSVRRNFSEWKNVRIVQGAVPDSLVEVDAPAVAYLHIDMNHAPPEVAALDHFWPLLVPGALVLLDDYGHFGFGSQKTAMDECARRKGVSVLSLPTGQGLIQKPFVRLRND